MAMIKEMMPQISLLVLVVVVAIGFIKKVNIGFFAIGATFLLTELAIAAGVEIESNGALRALKASDIAKGFSSSMFVTLVRSMTPGWSARAKSSVSHSRRL